MCQYQVVEGAGTDNESIVYECTSLDKARQYIKAEYLPNEIIDMNIDILKDGGTVY